MRTSPLRTLILLITVGIFAALLTSCTTGAKLRGQAMEIKSLNQSIHDRAYRCAPKQLAFAESNVEFGLYELSQGNFVQARSHLMLAEENARTADKLSDFDECRDQQVAMVVEKQPTVELEPKPDDRDGDGIPDNEDQCPDDPEDFDGFEDEDGCPDLDNDQDGIPDHQDRCPNIPGVPENDGCPMLDTDGDGILDINDQCPNEAEDFDGHEDEDGCPDPDNDGDGIADVIDECPSEPETYNGYKDEDGCPDEKPRAQIDGDKITLNEKVFFKTAKSDILPQSYPLLNDVANILTENPKIEIRIEGHTDSRGSDSYNQKLSEQRAASVRTYLLEQGIESNRMQSVGYGEQRPIEDNNTEAGRAANRRVEIHITRQ